MTQPRKIRVLYIDESPNATVRFIEMCGNKNIIDIVGTLHALSEILPLSEQDDYGFFDLLSPDVVVIHIPHSDPDICMRLQRLKSYCHIKIIGLLSEEYDNERNIISTLDYYTETSGIDRLMTDEDVYTHLLYQIKSARLALNTERSGIKGKWAILPLPKPSKFRKLRIIAMGASAGGTEAVSTILSSLPATLPPILIVQHIPDNFTEFFANNLASKIAMKIVVAHGGERLENGVVYIAGYDKHLEITRSEDGGYFTKCTHGDKVSGHRPSVDVLFTSVAKTAGPAAMGIILTGMGSDGAQGLLEMREAGAYTIGQDKQSSTVYGMPMVANSLGAVSKQLPLNSIAKTIISATSQYEKEDTQNE